MARNAKDKIRRTAQKYGVNLANEISVPKLKDIKTREQFKEVEEQLKSFTNRYNTKYQFVKNEHGVVASKRELNEIKENTKKAQRIAKKMLKEAEEKPFIVKGKQEGTVGQQMKQMAEPENLTGISVPKDFDFNKVMDRKRLDQKAEQMRERATPEHFDKKMEQLQANYILMLERSFNSDANELADRIKSMPADDFFEMFLMFREFEFNEYYTKEHMGESHDELLEQLNSYIDRYEDGDIDMDLKGF